MCIVMVRPLVSTLFEWSIPDKVQWGELYRIISLCRHGQKKIGDFIRALDDILFLQMKKGSIRIICTRMQLLFEKDGT